MQIPFVGDSSGGRSSNINASRSINFFVELNAADSKSAAALVGTPGTKVKAAFPEGPIRMMYTVVGRCFVVTGDKLYELGSGFTVSAPLGTFASVAGRIAVADNGTQGNQMLMISDTGGYIFNFALNQFTPISDANFPTNAKQVASLDGYFIVSDGSQVFKTSALGDGLTWPGLAYASAVATSDGIQRPFNLHQQLYLIKETSTEIWQDSGTPTTQGSPFQGVPGAVIDYGTPAPWSAARGSNTMFFLANARNHDSSSFSGVVMMNGYSPQIVSTAAISYRISQFSTISDAWGYCYTDEGHAFYVLTFPTADVTFCYDATTNAWHERSTHQSKSLKGNYDVPYKEHRHLADAYTFFQGCHLVGHFSEPSVLQMASHYYDDAGVPIIGIRTAQPIFDKNELENIKITKLVVDVEGGYSGVAWLSWSNDGGHTWSNEYECSLGEVGEYKTRLIWRRLGSPRNRIFRLRMPSASKKIIIGAHVNNGVLPS